MATSASHSRKQREPEAGHDHRCLRASVDRSRGPLAECRCRVRADHQRAAHLPRFSQLRAEDSAAELLGPAARNHPRRLAGRRIAVALHLHVDLRRQRSDVCDLSGCDRPLAPGAVYAARHQRRVADGRGITSCSARSHRWKPLTTRYRSLPTPPQFSLARFHFSAAW